MFPLICVWINGWVNNREAGDLRRCRAHYDVTIMKCIDFVHLANMTSLVSVRLDGSSIQRFPDTGCASSDNFIYANGVWHFPNLGGFFMSNNELTEFPLLPDAGSSSFHINLVLDHNNITNVSITRLELLKHATRLNLYINNNKIADMPHLSVLGPALKGWNWIVTKYHILTKSILMGWSI